MKVLMLGWEFPPSISGGLGTACAGLTRGLSQLGVDVFFVLPASATRPVAASSDSASSDSASTDSASTDSASTDSGPIRFLDADARPGPSGTNGGSPQTEPIATPLQNVDYLAVQCMLHPYQRPEEHPSTEGQPDAMAVSYPSLHGDYEPIGASFLRADQLDGADDSIPNESTPNKSISDAARHANGKNDTTTLFDEVNRYANRVVNLTKDETFDVIHAHDWMTFPAGLALARQTGKPLVVHVHSTEFDRTGGRIHSGIYEIERAGACAADRIITVSHLTRDMLLRHYGIDPGRVHVVYNAVDNEHDPSLTEETCVDPISQRNGRKSGRKNENGQGNSQKKTVLFLGRITVQKGPEYFLAAAQRVLQIMDNVRFVMVGSGDRIVESIRLARQLGIAENVTFTGFLRGKEVDQAFASADVFVMPSVSEPFGIAALEAVSHRVPVIVSKQSGVAEVLQHVLKVDYWNTEELANKIVAVLRYPPLRQALQHGSDEEVRAMSWVAQAQDCLDIYHEAMGTPTCDTDTDAVDEAVVQQ